MNLESKIFEIRYPRSIIRNPLSGSKNQKYVGVLVGRSASIGVSQLHATSLDFRIIKYTPSVEVHLLFILLFGLPYRR